MELIAFVPPIVALGIAGYWGVLLRRYPSEWPRGFEMLPFPRLRRTGRTWRTVAILGVVAALATAAFTLLLALRPS